MSDNLELSEEEEYTNKIYASLKDDDESSRDYSDSEENTMNYKNNESGFAQEPLPWVQTQRSRVGVSDVEAEEPRGRENQEEGVGSDSKGDEDDACVDTHDGDKDDKLLSDQSAHDFADISKYTAAEKQSKRRFWQSVSRNLVLLLSRRNRVIGWRLSVRSSNCKSTWVCGVHLTASRVAIN